MHDETAGTRPPEPGLLARHVRERRRTCGLSVPSLAEIAGLSEAWIAAVEEGTASADRTSLSRLAAALQTTVSRLVAGDDTDEPSPGASAPGTGTGDLRSRTMVDMSDDECYARLAMRSVGRVSSATREEPFVLPVNYMVDGRDVVFRTSPDSSLAEVAGSTAFEVDDLLDSARLGWSVLLTGHAERVTDADEMRRLAERAPEPWPGGDRPVWIRIRPDRVTGRRIAPHPHDV
ncbi:pyridoxamine 5'-phosphate oxidase family protein [Yinghuangia sp. ASG 101]|uniref:helix-turn-helix domain-containing protein n=1 Tax=Yinghuangia sp. ASG 101 TaxID=2896848 RepID=UPI001E52D5EC|nr:pyridoxamine 5'-phosphate oxidase family protein [Yinghuangia sp. ASG 101]UGQ11693.1 pyridoxamine 5'-phosphate oxidase family protein [Yinghuangia sp. ASG 101]